jgi:hypothetical protein
LNATVLETQEPELTPWPNPAKPPLSAEERGALYWIADGMTSAGVREELADPARFDAYLTAEGLCSLVPGNEDLGRGLAKVLVPGFVLAALMTDRAERRAAAMKRLESAGWTPASARAFLGLPAPRTEAA